MGKNRFLPFGRPVREAGFTLLEVVIALTIMILAFASIIMVESNSLNATTRARQMNIVAMLARNQMADLEYKVEGKTFEEFKKTDGGAFEAPYQDYRWTYEIKELEFPNLASDGGKKKEGEGGDQNYAEIIAKNIANFFSKSIREMNVTIFWKRGGGESSFTVSSYWVDLNHEFQFQM